MEDKTVIFDSRKEKYKNPVGAVTSGTEVTFTIMVSERLGVRNVKLVMKYDRHDEPAYYEMTHADHTASDVSQANMHDLAGDHDATHADESASDDNASNKARDGFYAFTCAIKIEDTGLYWYHFLIGTDAGELRIGKSDNRIGARNRAIITDSPNAWQQTVYARKYQTPEWICGGTFYHIFIDRFAKGNDDHVLCDEKNVQNEGADNRNASNIASDGESPIMRYELKGTREVSTEDLRETASGKLDHRVKILRDDWGGTPNWEPVDGTVLNNDFFGGNLHGIIEKLPYLADLGVTCLYLSPIFEAYSNHKYDTGDYERIDPMFGDEKTFTKLCCDAKSLGIRIILDGVFAHTGSDSKYFDKYGNYDERVSDGIIGDSRNPVTTGSYNGGSRTWNATDSSDHATGAANGGGDGAWGNPDSQYRSWYYFHEDGSYDSWWDFDTLPKLNKGDPGYIEYITGEHGIVRKWLRAGASGWRLDVADELPSAFVERLTAAAKAEKPDSLIIGEVWEDASNKTAYDERKNYFEGGRLDSVMNYPFRSAIIDFVRNGNSEQLAETVEQIIENYPKEVVDCLMNLLGTHDSVRIITALAGDDLGNDPSREVEAATHLTEEQWRRGIKLLKIASLLQMTLPGVPCIYYGDEAGIEGYKDPFNRTCYPWGHENIELLEWYHDILNFRKDNAVFRHGEYRTLAADDGLFAFERIDDNGCVIVAINMGDHSRSLYVDKDIQLEPEGMLVLTRTKH